MRLLLALLFVFTSITMAHAETSYERVSKSNTLRCSYAVWNPVLVKDPNSGAITGPIHDIVEEAAKNLGLKVDWVEEVGYGQMVEGLKAGRHDAFCTNVWPNSRRARHVAFTEPYFYTPIKAWVKSGNTKFDGNLDVINSPNVTVVTVDGEASDYIARKLFPKAKITALPQMTDLSVVLRTVHEGRGDVTFTDLSTANMYNGKNPGALAVVKTDRPIVVFPNTIAVAKDDLRLKDMMDTAMTELQNSGFIEATIKKYNLSADEYLMPSRTYRMPND